MSSIVRLALVLTAVITATAPGWTAETYVGTWASDLTQCSIPQEQQGAPLVVAKDRYDQHEAHCVFKSVDGSAPEWKIKADCTVEGSAEPYDFTLIVSGDTLTMGDDSGSRDMLRCQ